MEQLLAVIAGFIGVPLINALKELLGWEDKPVVLIAAFVSGVLAVGALFVDGQLTGGSFTLDALPQTIGLVVGTSQLLYALIKDHE